MSFHDDIDEWKRLSDPKNCPVCNDLPMTEGMVDIIELEQSWLNAKPVDCLKGACSMPAKVHAIELFDLNQAQLTSLMIEVQICARALKETTGAIKINYEIHGNTAPHLHIHLYPRYMDDPFPGRAIDYTKQKKWYTDQEFNSFVSMMRDRITQLKRAI